MASRVHATVQTIDWSRLKARGRGPATSEYERLDRRRFLKLMAASWALAGAACSGPPQQAIVPYVNARRRSSFPGSRFFSPRQ